jgi:putative tricarboxylic transport membrane protein
MVKPRTQDLAGGLVLLGIAAVALWQSADLAAGTLRQIGPGVMPRVLAAITGLCGLAMCAFALAGRGAMMGRWSMRGMLFVLAGMIAFALTVRPLGLAVAGPLVVIVSAFATSQVRWRETILFGTALTAACIILFKLLLRLPIPLAPWLIGY